MQRYMQVLLLGGLFIFSFNLSAKEELFSDVLVYMIKDKVYSLEDLNKAQRALKDFKCMYPDSFIVDYFNLIALKFDKRVFDQAKLKENSIPSVIYYPKAISQQDGYKKFPCVSSGVTNSESLASEVLSLPMYPYMDSKVIERISSIIAS